MHDTYTHTEACTQSFKDHLRTHIASRKQSLGSSGTFVNSSTAATDPQPGHGSPTTNATINNSNFSSTETLRPMEAPLCECGLPVKDEQLERLWGGEVEKATGKTKSANGPFCDCQRRMTLIEDRTPSPPAPEPKKTFKAKALDLMCAACTGYVAKPRAGGFYPNAE